MEDMAEEMYRINNECIDRYYVMVNMYIWQVYGDNYLIYA
jgi:hypothetical protein